MKNKIISAAIFISIGLSFSIVDADIQREEISGVTVNTSNAIAFSLTDQNFRNNSFNSSIKRAGMAGVILKCSSLVDLPGGENHSHGGLCTLEKEKIQTQVIICDDEMVGSFEMRENSTPISIQELINFVSSNCYGG